uniref:Uncharacterized protein n=1 Tax=Marseillevirus LCMAC103 TaxID=2506604 RepID=A0A481YTV7_9VIRU|nr:MAG: hypothetical protein LCMAC103_00840 [Marseillevirus LCMAC103]
MIATGGGTEIGEETEIGGEETETEIGGETVTGGGIGGGVNGAFSNKERNEKPKICLGLPTVKVNER